MSGLVTLDEKRALLARLLRERPAPLSFAQQRLWVLDRMEPGRAAYTIPAALRLKGVLDVDALRRALEEVVRRHEALRTAIREEDGVPVQVAATNAFTMELDSVSSFAEALRAVDAEVRRPFDLARGPLFRARLVRLAPGEHLLVVCVHHVVADGWSLGLLFREVTALYNAFRRGDASPLGDTGPRYAEYAAWQREQLSGAALERLAGYWKQALAGAPAALDLPTDLPRPPAPSLRGATYHGTVPAEVAERLRAVARAEGATLFMALLAAFQALLGRWSAQDDVVVGTPVAGRTRTELEGVVGCFVNTLALRGDLAGDPTFRELLARVRTATLGAYAHQDLPFERVVAELGAGRDASRHPVFQVMFALQNAPGGALALDGVEAARVELDRGSTHFDLTLFAWEAAGGLKLSWEYDTALFGEATVARMAEHFGRMLAGIAADPERRIGELPLAGAEERARVVEEWNRTEAGYPPLCIHQLFEAQAARTPGAVALVCGEGTLTYAQLDAAANRIAHRLRARGVGPETRVAICLERGAGMVAALLGVLKAGGAYVPLDPGYPRERIAYMLADSGAALLVTERRLRERLPEHAEVLCLDAERGAIAAEPSTAPTVGVRPENLAYVIYTSGSTGAPKGAMCQHGNAANQLLWMTEAHPLGAADAVLQKTPFSFDVSLLETVWPLASGARLVLARPGGEGDPAYLADTVRAHGVTTLVFVPSMLERFLAEPGVDACSTVRRVFATGEALAPELRTRFFARMGAELHNLYGPTETAIEVSSWTCGAEGAVPIGRPIANTRLYVLDAALAPVPVGVPGELFIAGLQVGRGYHARPGLTAERFIPDPFTPGARMYRTGDRARWTAGGALEYLGRADLQVKLRGFRVELGEVEAALRAEGAREAVAAVRDARLVAYVAGAADPERLRDALRARLPEPMVPAAVVVLDALPLTPSGKVDRAALPEPRWAGDGYAPPRDETEGVLCALYGEVLGAARVGVDDDFFALGGHSLLATRLAARMRDAFSVEVELSSVFHARTPARLARRVESARRGGGAAPLPRIAPAPRGGTAPVSFAQERMWFLEQMEPGSAVYNMPLALRLRGAPDVEALERALTEIVRRHGALRTTFAAADGRPVQVIHPARAVRLPVEAVDDEAATLREEARRPFDLAAGPLFRARLLRLSPDEHLLLVTMHHIVSDGWSLGVFARELSALYGGAELPEPEVQYADYAAWQREHLRGERLDAHLAYWTERLRGGPALLELPTDRPRPAVQSHGGASLRMVLPAQSVAELRALGLREGATLYMVLLAAWSVLLSRYAGQDEVVVGTPIAGRTRGEVEGLIGLFVNTLALRVDLSARPTFRELLRQVRATTLGAYGHQELPFERLVEALAPERSLGHTPLFQALFSLQNAPAAAVRLAGLEVEPARLEAGTTKFDLSLFAIEAGDELTLALRYRTELFEAETVRRMLDQFRLLLEGAAARPSACAAELPLMDADEQARLLGEPGAAGPPAGSIHGRFAAQAARTPHAAALVWGDETLSYAQLDDASARLAHALRARGVGAETRVALCMEPSPDAIVALLAVLRAGGAYVPLDPASPAERLAYMLGDSGARLVLADAARAGELAPHGVPVLALPCDAPAAPGPLPDVDARGLAYVIYTSGSTGRPKGVMVEHGGVCNAIDAHIRIYGVGEGARVLLFAPLHFDASVLDVFTTLCSGAALVVAPREELLPGEDLPALLARQRVTHAKFTPSTLAATPWAPLPELGTVISGGEACGGQVVARWAPGRRFFNAYGPTEASVRVTCAECADGTRPPPIGRPVDNVRAYVLDARGVPVPAGVPGELFVGGVQVARGYLGRPALTAERFVPDPFAGGRMYRTGDRVRWLASGELEFLGRTDDQVKLRGFRIEPGEIEAALRPHVRDALVMVREDAPGERRLVAYVVGARVAEGELRAHLRASLPEYMVPAAFVALDALPQNSNGKVDRRALPAPERGGEREGYVAPRTPAEEALCGIWAEVLGAGRVGVHDNFFELGGDSIQGIQVIARAARAGLRLTPRQLFQHQTVGELAPVAGTAVPREQGPVTGPLTLTPVQRAFLEREIPRPHHYNQSMLLEVRGELEPAVLHAALARLLEHHDALRLRFVRTARGWEAFHAPPTGAAAFESADLTALPEAARADAMAAAAAECQAGLDLAGGPLLRGILFDLGPERSARLLIVIHHLVVDGVSWRILLEDLETACRQLARGEPVSLPDKTTSFQHWAGRLAAHAPRLEDEAAFWLAQSASAPLPVDLHGDAGDAEHARTVWSALEAEETRALLQQVPRAYNTRIDDALLTALARNLTDWTGRDTVRVHLESHGREDLFGDVELARTVGWFTSLYPVELPRGTDPGAALRAVKERLRSVPAHGIGYGMLRHLTDGAAARALRAVPAPEVVFNYLGSFEQTFSPGSLFAPARESSGPARSGPRPHALEVTARVEGGRLRVGWSYGEGLHRRETVERLAGGFLGHLRELIAHCAAPGAGGYTPSDFPAARVSTAELDRLFALVGDNGLPEASMSQGRSNHG